MAKKTVAIVGRPNVGKSTLFNVLAGEKIAIIKDTPGVTRDRIYADCEWRNTKFRIIDTGGIEPESEDIILKQMRRQAELAMDIADVIVFITDVKAGVTPSDKEIALMLRHTKKPVILVCNKCDRVGEVPADIYEFYDLGLGDPLGISAGKKLGIGEMLDEIYDNLGDISEDSEEDDRIKVAIIGKPNVGKSSLINSLLKAYSDVQDNLITTSEFPGTTLDLIEIPLDENSSIYDSPGIVNRHQIAHLIDENTLKDILPQSELRPVNYQLNCKQTLYFGGLARLDFLNGSKTSMTCYFHRRLQIHRTKLENADALYNRHKTLKPEVEELKDIQSFKTYQFRLPENKVDVVISGLGFVTIHCPNALIEVKAPEQVGVFIREALI